MAKKETFRPQFDIEEVKQLAGERGKSKFYNEAIQKEIEYRKENTSYKYLELKQEVRDKQRIINLRIKDITEIEDRIEEYEKELRRLKRKQKRDLKKLSEMNTELEKLKTTRKRAKRTKKDYKKLIEENKDTIYYFVNEIISQLYDINKIYRGLPRFIKKWYHDDERFNNLSEIFGTFEEFMTKYFYPYVETEIIPQEDYKIIVLDPNTLTPKPSNIYYLYESEVRGQLKRILKNKDIHKNFYD